MITIVFGPRACGKTRNAAALMAKYGCDAVFDLDEFARFPERDRARYREGNLLLLTTDEGDDLAAARRLAPEVRLVPFSQTGMK